MSTLKQASCRLGDEAPFDGPYVFGESIDLVELPFAWHLDDYPFFEYVASRKRVSPGLADPARVFEVWTGDFDYLYDRVGEGVFTLTMHPQVIGRGHRLLLLERVIEHIRQRKGVVFAKMEDVAREWREAHPVETYSDGRRAASAVSWQSSSLRMPPPTIWMGSRRRWRTSSRRSSTQRYLSARLSRIQRITAPSLSGESSGDVSALLARPGDPRCLLVLAHSAGADMNHRVKRK